MKKPYCIIVTGRPGSGKTTLAAKLGEALHLPVVSRDVIKEGLVVSTDSTHEALPEDTNRQATEAFFESTRLLLDSGVSVVVEAAFQHKVWSMAIPDWLGLSRTRVLLCDTNSTICAQRHLNRGLADLSRERFHGDHRVRHFRATGEVLGPSDYEPPQFDCPLLRVDTENDYEPSFAEIIRWLAIEEPKQTIQATTTRAKP